MISLAIALSLRLTFTPTLWGKAFIAASENPDTAKIMGINVEGAIAGILYGIVESLAVGYLGGSYREILGFIIVILVLTLKPKGLFAKSQILKI